MYINKIGRKIGISAIASLMILMLLFCCACGTIVPSKEDDIKKQAIDVYTLFSIDHESSSEYCFLYVSEGQIVTIEKGIATGVYTNRDEAMQSMYDDPETDDDESKEYRAMATTSEGLYVCSRKMVVDKNLAKNAYANYISSHYNDIDACFIYVDGKYYVPIKNGNVLSELKTEDAALEVLFGDDAQLYRTEDTEVSGLLICVNR